MTWAYFADEIETATKTTLDADPAIGTDGTLGVATREVEPPQPAAGAPETYQEQLPYVGIRCTPGKSRLFGTKALAIEHELRLRVLVDQNTAASGYELAMKIVETCARAIREKCGSSAWLASTRQALMDSWSCDEPSSDAENPYVFETIAKIPIVVIYPED